jgi:RHS repeat-associated protein
MLYANVATGETCCSAVDFSLSGFVPVELERNYRSLSAHDGVLGRNWRCFLDAGLEEHDGVFTYRDAWGVETALQSVRDDDERLLALATGHRLLRLGGELLLEAPGLMRLYFRPRSRKGMTRPHRVEDRNGNAVRFELDADGLPERLTDTLGRELRLEFGAAGKLAEVRLRRPVPALPTVLARYAHDRQGRLTAVATPAGTWRFEYADDLIVRLQSPVGFSCHATYDDQRRCTALWCNDGVRYRRLDYDDVRQVTRVVDALGRTTLHRYNAAGLVTETIDALGGVETNVYDAANQLLATFDPAGKVVTLTTLDRETRTLAVTDAAGAVTIFQDDEHGQLRRSVDACGAVCRWHYDARGNLTSFEMPSGARSTLEYDERGFLARITDVSGRTFTQRRSGDGRTITVQDALGTIARYEYDDLGDLVAATDGNAVRRQLRRDEAGRLIRVEWPDGSAVGYDYDAAGNLVRVIDELGHETRLDYDAFGKCVRVRGPLGKVVRYEYDLEENPVAVVNETGEVHRWDYDVLGRVVRQQFFDGREEHYEYDPVGRVVAVTDGTGGVTRLVRDDVGNVVEKLFPDGSRESLGYDPLRRLLRVENDAGAVELEWSPDGHLARELQGDATLDFTYDAAGNRLSLSTADGRRIRYEYDARRRLVVIDDNVTGAHRLTYDGADLLSEIAYPNGATLRRRHDARQRVVQETLVQDTRVLFDRSYDFDAADRLVGVADADGTSSRRLEYDAQDRLLAIRTEAGILERYEYDGAGNLLSSSLTGDFVYEPGSLLVRGPDGARDYDARGALVCRRTADTAYRFEYDGAGRLARVLGQDTTVVELSHDGFARRLQKRDGERSTRFVWDGFVLLSEEEEGADKTEYLFAPGQMAPLSRRRAGRVEHLVVDRRGCVSAIVDQEGLLSRFDYSAFGELRTAPGDVTHPFRLRGQYYDEATGLHYNLHRYYDAASGRFLTRDPLGLEGGRNLYRAGANPITWEDPFGLSGECQGDTFYRAMSDKEKARVMKNCQLLAKQSKCPEGPYVTQNRTYCEQAMAKKPKDYKWLVEICTKPGTKDRLSSSSFACRNGSQAAEFPSLPDVVSGNANRIEHKMERGGLNYGLSKGEGLKQFNGEIESMKVAGTNETCTPKR